MFEPELVLICGPSCIGKTYFTHHHNFTSVFASAPSFKLILKLIKELANFKSQLHDQTINSLSIPVHMALVMPLLLSRRRINRRTARTRKLNSKWNKQWDLINKHPIKKRAIILGVPYSEWQKRLKKRNGDSRVTDTVKHGILGFINNYKDAYVEWIKELDHHNIPYIFIDNRNDYPVLDKSNFLKMLTENKK